MRMQTTPISFPIEFSFAKTDYKAYVDRLELVPIHYLVSMVNNTVEGNRAPLIFSGNIVTHHLDHKFLHRDPLFVDKVIDEITRHCLSESIELV